MREDICGAIQNKLILEFAYKGARRRAEPHALGIDSKGHLTMCAWQLSGGSGVGFRDFHLDELSSLQITEDGFVSPRPGYRRGDSTMTTIFCQL
jgi:hypothetical protein